MHKSLGAAALLSALLSPALFCSGQAMADAGTLSRGDVSVGLSMVYEPFNTYWYYSGPDTSLPYDEARYVEDYNPLSLSNYSAEDLIGTQVNLFNTGLRFEFGLLDNVSLWGETQFVRGGLADNPEASTASIGDSRLGARFGLSQDGPVIASLSTVLKIPGLYAIEQAYSPGDGQTDFDVKLSVGGLGLRRRMFWDVGLGYRFRFPYGTPGELSYVVEADPNCTPTETSPCETYEVFFVRDGPANETFADATVGYYLSRQTLAFFNIQGVDSHKGASWDDVNAAWENGAPGNVLFTELEEDYLRVGIGALVKPRPSMTAYVNYSYVVAGRNTAAFLRTDSGVPIGTIAGGLEITFGTASPGMVQAQDTRSEAQALLSTRFSEL